MWTIKQSGQFKRDLKREAKGPYRQTLQREFVRLVEALANDQPLAEKHRDHALSGEWQDHRDCHIKPDLVLIYRKTCNSSASARIASWACERPLSAQDQERHKASVTLHLPPSHGCSTEKIKKTGGIKAYGTLILA